MATLVHPQGPESRLAGPEPQAASPSRPEAGPGEAELDTCRAKLRAVEALQLLEVLEEKLRLRQEVEAWEVRQGLPAGLWEAGPDKHKPGP